MKKVVIGTQGEFFDLEVLLLTRLLIQANSGGGKSYLIRRMVERLFDHVPVIIIDPEGEFATLREQFDFILVGKGGETPADPRSAALLAEKLLELNVSAICDIYELKTSDRHRWVKLFLDAMINAPKHLWHPVVIVIDEAHIFCPEKGQGESEAYGSVIDLATRGRKRGFCSVLATQRLGKLSKNASAELQNVLIGSTFQDIDRKRAAETLGVLKSDERQFFNDIKLLEPGNFYALGRAISKERIELKVAPVITSHPQSGKYKATPPSTPDKIKSLLPKLSDLPAEADERNKSMDELRKEIATLKKQLKSVPTETKIVEKPVITDAQIKKYEKILLALEAMSDKHGKALVLFWENLDEQAKSLLGALQAINADLNKKPIQNVPKTAITPVVQRQAAKQNLPATENGGIGKCERAILTVLAQRNQKSSKNQVAILSGYSVTSGSFNNSLSSLRTKGYISGGGDAMVITGVGVDALGPYDPLPTGEDLHQYWYRELGKAEAEILKTLISNHPNSLIKTQIAVATGYSDTSGSFNNALSRLRTLELIEGYKDMKASDSLFE